MVMLGSLGPASLKRWFYLLNEPRMSSKNRAFVSRAAADGGGVATQTIAPLPPTWTSEP